MPGLTIIGSGHHVPGEPVTNDDPRAGHGHLRRVDPSAFGDRAALLRARGRGGSAALALPAAQRALESAGITAEELDYIIFGTMTPDFVLPGSGGLLGAELGIAGVPALDIRQQCAFFPFAMQIADSLSTSGVASTILVAGANAHAGFMPWDWEALETGRPSDEEAYRFATSHRATAVLFGDGAGALVCRPHPRAAEGYGLIGSLTKTDGSRHDHFFVPAGGVHAPPLLGGAGRRAHPEHARARALQVRRPAPPGGGAGALRAARDRARRHRLVHRAPGQRPHQRRGGREASASRSTRSRATSPASETPPTRPSRS